MTRLKQFINDYSKYYISAVMLLWIVTFLISWDTLFFGIPIYLFIMKRVFVAIGLITIAMGVLTRKLSLLIWGMVFLYAFLINLFLLFTVLPIFLGN